MLELADCIHHLTGRPAPALRLADRGLVRAGYAADLVLFDPDTVRDTATFDDPRQQAEGIAWVLRQRRRRDRGRPPDRRTARARAAPDRLRHAFTLAAAQPAATEAGADQEQGAGDGIDE